MAERDWQKDWELCKKALPPKWLVVRTRQMPDFGTWQVVATVGAMGEWKIVREWQLDGFEDRDIAHFIAAAREGWPAALEERARLEERVRELEGAFMRIVAMDLGETEGLLGETTTCHVCEDVFNIACKALGVDPVRADELHYRPEKERLSLLRRLMKREADNG